MAGLAALTACGGADRMEAGEWETTYSVVDISMPGARPEMINQMKQTKETQRSCLTEEEARRPMEKMIQKGQNENCSMQDMKMENGRISGSMSCQAPRGGGEMKAEVDGEYTAEDMSMNVKTNMPNPMDPNQQMQMTMRMEGRRVGECNESKSST